MAAPLSATPVGALRRVTELLRRAQAGDVSAYDLLADSYLNAEGDQRDVEAAVRWLNAGSRPATPAA
jgi:TPR repeat protein